MENKKDPNETDFSTESIETKDLEQKPEQKQEEKQEEKPKQKQDLHEFNNLLKKIETDGENMLKQLKVDGNVNGDSLLNLMQTGEKEFIKKTGRRMTYAEMRQAYG
jgi:hypothetical protein